MGAYNAISGQSNVAQQMAQTYSNIDISQLYMRFK